MKKKTMSGNLEETDVREKKLFEVLKQANSYSFAQTLQERYFLP